MSTREAHGWKIYFWTLFNDRFTAVRQNFRQAKAQLDAGTLNVDQFNKLPNVKLYLALVNIIHEVVPLDPTNSAFRQGNTLGDKNKDWYRVKGHGLPSRSRLFFRFSTAPEKIIVFAWLNDESSLRKEGASTDVYTVFKGMLANKQPPTDFAELMKVVSSGK